MKMGNICSALRPQKKMLTPRDIYDLADTVDTEILARDGAELDLVSLRSPWISAFLRSPRMVEERRELFLFVVLCQALINTPPTERDATGRLLELARTRFFSDSEFWQCSVAFADIHNDLDEIFRLFYIEKANEREGLVSQMNGQTTSLRQKLIALRQDEVVRSSLEPVYGVFLKQRELHPSSVLQQCLLSIL